MTDRTFLKTLKGRFFVISAIPVCVAVLEIGLRIGFGFGTPLLSQKDPDVGYLFQPNQNIVRFGNSVRINRAHQRADDFTPKAASNSFRVLAVGDSVAFGGTALDQSETITAQLQQQLRAEGQSGAQVLNASAGSWGIGNELAYLQKFGTCDAKWIVLQIGSHDLLQQKSTSDPVGVHPSMPDHRPLLAVEEVWSRYVKPRFFGLAASATTRRLPAQEQFFDNMDSLLHALALIRNASARPLILHTPERSEVIDSEGGDDMYAQWRDSFLDIAMREQVPIINLAELWRRDPAVASYFNDHVHLTAAGNASAARHLAQFLLSAEHQHFKPGGDDIIVKFDSEKGARVTRPSDEMGRPSDQSSALKGGFFSEGRVTRDLPSQTEQPTRKEP